VRFAALAVAIGLGSGCFPPMPAVPMLPAPASLDAETAHDDHPIARLGRWNGERFDEVEEGAIPASHLRVIVHGWARGWGSRVRSSPMHAWEAVDERGRPFEPWMHALARTIAEHDRYAIVLSYSWLDDAATGRAALAQRRALVHTSQHGALLSRALEAAIAPDFRARGGQIHLLGHSLGARVATAAALELDPPPIQLTLFDAPESAAVRMTGSQANLGELLRALPLGWGAGRTFVDNYVAAVGVRYRGRDPSIGPLVEVTLSPPHSILDYGHRHTYPMQFYAETSGSPFGLGWSPLTAGASAPEPGCWEQPFGETSLHHGCNEL
jgi:hypothetical protein